MEPLFYLVTFFAAVFFFNFFIINPFAEKFKKKLKEDSKFLDPDWNPLEEMLKKEPEKLGDKKEEVFRFLCQIAARPEEFHRDYGSYDHRSGFQFWSFEDGLIVNFNYESFKLDEEKMKVLTQIWHGNLKRFHKEQAEKQNQEILDKAFAAIKQ